MWPVKMSTPVSLAQLMELRVPVRRHPPKPGSTGETSINSELLTYVCHTYVIII